MEGQPDEDAGSGEPKEEDCAAAMFRFQEDIALYDMVCDWDHLFGFDLGRSDSELCVKQTNVIKYISISVFLIYQELITNTN